ncbi:MAG: suppressor of fused domain protein [Clostridium sp.]|nr:suppressor of fused domain protein [Clostridium sp.]
MLKKKLEKLFRKNNGESTDTTTADVDYESYVSEHLGEIVQYYDEEDILELFWGGVQMVNDNTSVNVYGILPRGKEYGVVITSGMSEYPMARTDEGLEFAEVMMKIPRAWLEQGNLLEDDEHSWVIEILCKTAYLGHMYEGSYVNEKVIVPYGTPDEAYPFDWDYEFTSVMLCPSEDIPVLQTDVETKIKFYTLVPITEEEGELVKEQGSVRVREQLSSGDKVDLDRELLVETE